VCLAAGALSANRDRTDAVMGPGDRNAERSMPDRALARRYVHGPLRQAHRATVVSVRVRGSDTVHQLNEVAAVILGLVDGRPLVHVLADLRNRYTGVAEETLHTDLLTTVRRFAASGIIVRTDETNARGTERPRR
jgi:hypothetical protein